MMLIIEDHMFKITLRSGNIVGYKNYKLNKEILIQLESNMSNIIDMLLDNGDVYVKANNIISHKYVGDNDDILISNYKSINIYGYDKYGNDVEVNIQSERYKNTPWYKKLIYQTKSA